MDVKSTTHPTPLEQQHNMEESDDKRSGTRAWQFQSDDLLGSAP